MELFDYIYNNDIISITNYNNNINFENLENMTPLFIAIELNNLEVVKLLIKKNANVNYVNKQGIFAIILAIYNNNFLIIRELLKADANINRIENSKYIPLLCAIKYNDYETIKYLILFGSNINYECSKTGDTPLKYAIRLNKLDIVKLLIINKAEINALCSNKVSPLHIACYYNFNDIAQYLIDNGANPYLETKYGWTATKYATKNNNSNLLNILIRNHIDI